MNYYQHHIGDYLSHTAHLSPIQDLAYRRMRDRYYLTEQALPREPKAVAKLIRLTDCLTDVEEVLAEFFSLEESGWVSNLCDSEIERMQDKQNKAKASAACSVQARSTNAQRTLSERSTNAQRTLNERSTNAELGGQTNAELPTPTPTPTPTPKEQERALEIPNPENQPENVKAVLAMKSAGVLATTPNNPDLLTALAEGVTAELLGEIAAKNQSKPQLWIVRAALGQMRDAKANAASPRASPSWAKKSNAVQPSAPGTYGEDDPLPELLQ